MMKKRSLSISIPEPCHESWDHMSPRKNGRHCSLCQKTVVDFTGLTDSQVKQIINNNDSLCGRFHVSQLDRPILPKVKYKSSLWKYAAMFLGIAGISFPVAAQVQSSPDPSTEIVETRGKIKIGEFVKPDPIKTAKGTVVDQNGDVLIGANVLVKGTTTGTVTNIDGHFSMDLPVFEKPTLVVSYTGYTSLEVEIRSEKDTVITLQEDWANLIGVIVMGYGVPSNHVLDEYTHENGFQTLKRRYNDLKDLIKSSYSAARESIRKRDRTRNERTEIDSKTIIPVPILDEPTTISSGPERIDFTVFPNPTWGKISLDIQTSIPRECTIEIVSLIGERIIRTHHHLSAGTNTIVMPVENIPNGMYLCNLYSAGEFSGSQTFVKGEF